LPSGSISISPLSAFAASFIESTIFTYPVQRLVHAQDAIDLIVGRVRSFIDQVFGSNYYPGRAEAALQAASGDEALGKSIALQLAEALKRQHGLSGNALCRHRA
jgi:hypothetical protein